MSNHLNPLDPNALQIVTNETTSPLFYQTEGAEISWVEVQSKTGTTFNDDVNSHHWTNLGIYSESNITPFGVTKANGGFSDTMIGGIYKAYNSTGLLVGSIASTAYRASIYPNLKLTIPITGGTGTLSGLTSLNLYSAFVEQNNSTTPNGSGPCATWLVDSLCSESDPGTTYQAGIGYAMDGVNNPSSNTGGQYQSGFVHLFANEIYLTGNTGTTWDTAWSGDSRYTFGGSPLAKASGTDRNKAVGILQLDSGTITLYDSEVVGLFNTAVATGGTITSGLTFPTTECGMINKDKDLSTVLNINTVLTPETFTQSRNPSLLDAAKIGETCDGQVSVTKICFFDELGVLTATGLLETPIVKRTEDFTTVVSQVTLDGGQKFPVYNPSGDGVTFVRTTY